MKQKQKTRRGLIKTALITSLSITSAGILPACGFKLYKAPKLSFKTIILQMPKTPLYQELKRRLKEQEQITVLEEIPKGETSQSEPIVIFKSAGESQQKTIVSKTSSGEVREYQLGISITYELTSLNGQTILAPSTINRQLDQSYSETAALSKDLEAAQLYQSMQSDIAMQVMRQLAVAHLSNSTTTNQ